MKRLLARALAGAIAATTLSGIVAGAPARADTECATGLVRYRGMLSIALDESFHTENSGSVTGGIYAVPVASANPADHVASAPLGGPFGGYTLCLPAGQYRFFLNISSPAYGLGNGWFHEHQDSALVGAPVVRKLVSSATEATVYPIDAAHDDGSFTVDTPSLAATKDARLVALREAAAARAAEIAAVQAAERAAAQEAAAQAAAAAAAAAKQAAATTAGTAPAMYVGKILVPGSIVKKGTPAVGRTLRIKAPTAGTFFAKPLTQWYVGGKKIPGATKATLRVKPAYRGKAITVKVTYVDTFPVGTPRRPTVKNASFGKAR